ncbi:hypothetical protein STEG23_004701, partial [Scotinomys teguina]
PWNHKRSFLEENIFTATSIPHHLPRQTSPNRPLMMLSCNTMGLATVLRASSGKPYFSGSSITEVTNTMRSSQQLRAAAAASMFPLLLFVAQPKLQLLLSKRLRLPSNSGSSCLCLLQ